MLRVIAAAHSAYRDGRDLPAIRRIVGGIIHGRYGWDDIERRRVPLRIRIGIRGNQRKLLACRETNRLAGRPDLHPALVDDAWMGLYPHVVMYFRNLARQFETDDVDVDNGCTRQDTLSQTIITLVESWVAVAIDEELAVFAALDTLY